MKHGRVLLGFMLAAWLGAQESAPPPGTAPALQLRARVCDAAGQPLGNAGIVVGSPEVITTTEALSRPLARSATNGILELAVPRPQSDFQTPTVLLIAAPGKVAFRLPNLQFLLQRSPLQDETVLDLGEIRLPDGFTLSGRVRGPGGVPISGAHIRAIDSLTTYPWICPCYGSQVTTGENGVFLLRGVFANAMTVTVAADGYYSRTFPAMDLAAPFDVQLEASGFVEGTVLDEAGKPFEGLVMATHEFVGAQRPPVRSVQGKFRFGVTTPCRLRVFAFDPATGRVSDGRLLHGPAAGVELRFGVSSEKVFVIRAVDAATDQPIAEIRASAFWFEDEVTGSIERTLVAELQGSGTDGKVWLEPPPPGFPNKGVVHVAAAGRAPFFAQGIECKDGQEFVARLEPESHIEGRVVDAATGTPAAGMAVTCERVRKQQGSFGNGPPPHASVLTAEDGSFTFRGLCEGDHEVAVRWPGGTAMVSKRATLKTAEVRKDLELALPEGVTVTGKITGAELARGWKVQFAKAEQEPVEDPWSAGGSVLEAWNLEDAQPLTDGAFRFEHRAAGTEQLFLVVPLPPRHGAALRIPLTTVRIVKDDVTLDVDAGKHLPGAVSGKVTVGGAELPGGRLAVMTIRLGGDKGRWEEQMRLRHWALVAADGTFEIPAAAGTYALEAIDVATGVTLGRIADPVTVAAGKPTKRDLRVDVVAARVRFETADKGRLNAERVEIQVGADADDWQITMFGGGQRGSPGVDLAGVREVQFFVPPGQVRLRVEVGAILDCRHIQFGSHHAEETFEAELGKVSELTMTLPPPADLGGK